MHDRSHVLAAILTKWRHPLASTKALSLFYWAMHAVLYRRTSVDIKMARKVGPFFVVVLFAVALASAGAIGSK
jgi:hypothetical protein